ncbi:MAG: DUF1365 domain-containing protein [Pseudomonadota bacterium]
MSDASLYHGRVVHRRLRPKAHQLGYDVFSLMVDVDALSALDARLRRFSRGKFNFYSFYDRDHGTGAADDIGAYVRGELRRAGFVADGPIRLLCYPRMLGYVFNPISVYYGYRADGTLESVLYEVSSTFGERHAYLAAVDDPYAPVIRHQADKRLHVSPFMAMETRYWFRVNAPGDTLRLAIRQTDADGVIFHASFAGAREEMSDAALMRAFRRYPLMTLAVIGGIHWEAVKLLAKGMRLRAGPRAPSEPVSLITPPPRSPGGARALNVDAACAMR